MGATVFYKKSHVILMYVQGKYDFDLAPHSKGEDLILMYMQGKFDFEPTRRNKAILYFFTP